MFLASLFVIIFCMYTLRNIFKLEIPPPNGRKIEEESLAIFKYQSFFGRGSATNHEEKLDKRKEAYASMVNNFYDLVTEFYRYGWGDSFHFACRNLKEGFHESITRSEHYIALKLGLRHEDKCLDLGCGVGGPMKCIAAFSGANITGINNNAHQVSLFNREIRNETHLRPTQCSMVKADFMDLPSEMNGKFDAAYSIEAMCHSPDKTKSFEQVFQCLKPGAKFMIYDWCITPEYDPNDKEHVRIRQGIEVGNSLPALATFSEVIQAMETAGFEILESRDIQYITLPHIPWYATLQGEWSFKGFRMTRWGRRCAHFLVRCLESFGVAPRGSVMVSQLLNDAADDLVSGGVEGIFTPTYCVIAQKPATRGVSLD